MQIDTYLSFSGTCEEAFQLYAKVLGGNIEFTMTYGDSAMAGQAPPDWGKKIAHTRLRAGGKTLLGSDNMPGHYSKPAGFSVSVSVATPEEAERIFQGLSENASVKMPMQKTFWSERFGMLIDKFGTPWMINCDPNA
jgi:PhnB protein